MLDDPAAEVRVVAQGLVMTVESAAVCYDTAGKWSGRAAVGCRLDWPSILWQWRPLRHICTACLLCSCGASIEAAAHCR